MDSLTFKKNGKVGVVGMSEYNETEKLIACVERLHEYERSGITPEFLCTVPDILEDISNYLDDPLRRSQVLNARISVNYLLANIKNSR